MVEPKPPEPSFDEEAARALDRGFEEFNSGKFFECHDTLEEVWQGNRGPERGFLQGLIQISVGFYHLGNGNLRGGERQLARGLANLEPYGAFYAGMDLAALAAEVEEWLRKVRAGETLRAKVADLPKYRRAV
jgi:predicted metal-dependent hydrolase